MQREGFVTVLNRSSLPIDATWDGRCHTLAPHEEGVFPWAVAEKFKAQNPVMGTEDFTDPLSAQTLAAVKEWHDDATPIEQSDAVERIDRDSIIQEPDSQTVTMRMGSKGKRTRAAVSVNAKNPTGIQASYDE